MPKDDTTQIAASDQQPKSSTPPPVLEDVILPPTVPAAAQSPTLDTKQSVDTGSAAPSNDVVMNTTPISTMPRKKYAGGKIIATILGLFLLVGGLGAGVYLTQQNQNPNEQAATKGNDALAVKPPVVKPPAPKNNDELGSGNTDPVTPPAPKDNDTLSNAPAPKDNNDLNSGGLLGSHCTGPSGCHTGYACVGSEPSTATCVPADSIEGQAFCDGNTPGVPESIGECCVTGATTSYNYETGQPFIGNHWTTCQTGYTCRQGEGCFPSGNIGGGNNPTTPPVTVTPSPEPITASCQNIKAYSTNNWSLIPAASLSSLKSGQDSVYFCVAGTLTGGSFDKARFTINGSLQAETTTVRPNSADLCQLYNLPAGVANYNVTAEIHHVTLGWK